MKVRILSSAQEDLAEDFRFLRKTNKQPSLAILPRLGVLHSFCSMKTLSKPAAKKPLVKRLTRKSAGRKRSGTTNVDSEGVRLTPPPAKATTADLLRSLRDGSYDAAAAKVDWDIVERVVSNRRSAPTLRAAS